MNQLHVAIPVYNRVKAFRRLLKSFRLTSKPSDLAINLHFFIDLSAHQQEIQAIIDGFEWPVGNKYSYLNHQHFGLNGNIMRCGRLALDCGHVVIIEDDLFVSPYLWHFCSKLLCRDHSEKTGGIGLYNYIRNDFQWPFYPLSNSYFLTRVCTWGEIFTSYQWQQFELWLQKTFSIPEEYIVDKLQEKKQYIWDKLFNHFLIETERYFFHISNCSVSTNFGNIGTNVKRLDEENAFQVPLQMDSQLPDVPKIEETTAVYDAFFELLPSRMKGLNPNLENYDFEVDLYGTKPFEEIQKPYVLSCKKALNPEITFGRNLKPHELNIAYEIEGKDFFLAKKEHFRENLIDKWRRELRTHYYHYPDVSITKVMKMKIFEIVNRFL